MTRLLTELRLASVERPELPEVLDLERGGIAGDLPCKVEEVDVGLRRLGATAADGKAFCFHRFLEIGDDIGLELLGQVRQQLVLRAQLRCRFRVVR